MPNHLKKTRERGNDTSESLETLNETDTGKCKHTLKVSVKTNETEKKFEERLCELEHKAELDEAMRRTKNHGPKKFKAHVELW